MNPATPSPKSREERDAIFAKVFANVIPADQPKPNVFEQMEEYREQIATKRQEGFSFRQIADGLREDPISIKASIHKVRAFLRDLPATPPKKPVKNPAKKPEILRPIIPLPATAFAPKK